MKNLEFDDVVSFRFCVSGRSVSICFEYVMGLVQPLKNIAVMMLLLLKQDGRTEEEKEDMLWSLSFAALCLTCATFNLVSPPFDCLAQVASVCFISSEKELISWTKVHSNYSQRLGQLCLRLPRHDPQRTARIDYLIPPRSLAKPLLFSPLIKTSAPATTYTAAHQGSPLWSPSTLQGVCCQSSTEGVVL